MTQADASDGETGGGPTPICLYFHVHQPYRLRRYSFFDIAREPRYWLTYCLLILGEQPSLPPRG